VADHRHGARANAFDGSAPRRPLGREEFRKVIGHFATGAITFGWAADARGAGVRINAISPVARTQMSEGAAGVDAAAMADPDAIAPVVVFLLSDRSSPITGRVVRFDGRALSVFGPDVEKAAAQVAARWSARDIEAAVKRLAGPAT
jgi:hypothetical protein